MAQTTILAAGTTVATSTDVVVAAGSTVSISIFTDNAAGLPGNHSVTVWMDTPSAVDVFVAELTGGSPATVVSGPGTFRAKRGFGLSTNVGVFTES